MHGKWKITYTFLLLFFIEISCNYIFSKDSPNPIFDLSFSLIYHSNIISID